MVISEETLAYAESAFTTETTISKLLKNENSVIFRIVSDIKMGYELWKKPNPLLPIADQPPLSKHVFRAEDYSKAKALREPHDDKITPFLFFCAYLHAKKTLQIVKVTGKFVFEDIVAIYRKFQPENIYDFATCQVQKTVEGGQNKYVFNLITKLDENFATQVARSEPPEECLRLLKMMPFDLENVYENKDAFDV